MRNFMGGTLMRVGRELIMVMLVADPLTLASEVMIVFVFKFESFDTVVKSHKLLVFLYRE